MIFSFLSFALIIITGIWLLWTIVMFADNFGDGIMALVIGLFFVVLLGWCIVGQAWPTIPLSREVPAKLIKTDTSIIVTIADKPVMTITQVANFLRFSQTNQTMLIEDGYVNIYGETNWYSSYKLQ